MPSRMKLRATKFRMLSQCVVLLWIRSRSLNPKVSGSDFTSQKRRSPSWRGAKTASHAPPDFFLAGLVAFGFLAAAFFFGAFDFLAIDRWITSPTTALLATRSGL